MQVSIEYISAGIILLLILGATGQYTTNLVYNRLDLISQTNGQERVDRIIDALLLSPGNQPDWGRNYAEPTAMGLASANAINLYQLDANKVGRLASGTTNSISPYRVRDLLGLSAEYYISIKIFPLLNMSFEKISDELFSVKLSNQWGVSVSNINVTAAYTSTCVSNITAADITSFMDNALQNATYASNMTNALGTCTLNFQGAGARSSLLVMAGRYSIKCLTSWPTLSEYILVEVESSMGSPSNFEVETTYRNVEINGLSYVARLTMWR